MSKQPKSDAAFEHRLSEGQRGPGATAGQSLEQEVPCRGTLRLNKTTGELYLIDQDVNAWTMRDFRKAKRRGISPVVFTDDAADIRQFHPYDHKATARQYFFRLGEYHGIDVRELLRQLAEAKRLPPDPGSEAGKLARHYRRYVRNPALALSEEQLEMDARLRSALGPVPNFKRPELRPDGMLIDEAGLRWHVGDVRTTNRQRRAPVELADPRAYAREFYPEAHSAPARRYLFANGESRGADVGSVVRQLAAAQEVSAPPPLRS